MKFFRFNAGLAAILIAIAFAFRPTGDERARSRASRSLALVVAEAAIVLYWATSAARSRRSGRPSSAIGCAAGLVALVAQALAVSAGGPSRRRR